MSIFVMKANLTVPFRPAVEALEERWLLDSRISLGSLGGPVQYDPLYSQCLEVSILTLGGAISAALLFNPTGGGGGGGGGSAPGGGGGGSATAIPVESLPALVAPEMIPVVLPVPDDVLNTVVCSILPR